MLARYSVIELLRQAIKEEVPVVVVEGKDDKPFYEGIIMLSGKEMALYGVGHIKWSGTSNCEEIIRLFTQKRFQAELSKRDNQKYILGIIDGDARDYKPLEHQNYKKILSLYKLVFYSFESYFVSEENLKHLLESVTRFPKRKTTQQTVDYFFKKFDTIKKRMFLASVDCLKGLQDNSYTSYFSFENTSFTSFINDHRIDGIISQREVDLDGFINSNGINIDKDFKKIIKGKWLLNSFSQIIYDELKNILRNCNTVNVDKCSYCNKMINNENCEWKYKNTIPNSNILETFIYLNTDSPEFDEIKNVINALGNP